MTVIHMEMGVIQDTLCPVLQVSPKRIVNITVIHPKNYTDNTGSSPYYPRFVLQGWLLPNFRILKFSNNISSIKKEKKDYKELDLEGINERSEFVSLAKCNTGELVIHFIAFGDACGVLGTK